MNKEIEELLSIISEGQNSIQLQEIEKYITDLQEENEKLKKNYNRIYNENCKLRKRHNITDISLLDENQKLNKIIDDLENWLKETKKFNFGFEIKSEYAYVHEFVYKNVLSKLTQLKNEVE